MALLPMKQEDSDGGWTTLSTGVLYRKQGDDVIIRISNGLSASDNWENIGTLPVGYQPTVQTSLAAVAYNTGGSLGYGAGLIRVEDDGTVSTRTAKDFNYILGEVRFSIG